MLTPIHPKTREALREAIRSVHQMAGISLLDNDETTRPLAIGVTSPRTSEGKTTVALALASSLAEDLDAEVALVDADFITHSVERIYGLAGQDGISDVLEGSASVDAVTHRMPYARLSVIPAGTAVAEQARVARSEDARALIDELKEQNRFTVMDLPAVLPTTTAAVLASLCDGVIVVVDAGRTQQRDIELTLEQLQRSNVMGVVINRWSTSVPAWAQHSLGLKA